MLQQLARWILYKRMGWKTIITVEHPSKYIICLAPHTSNWDFVIGQLFGLAERRTTNFLMKKEWFSGSAVQTLGRHTRISRPQYEHDRYAGAGCEGAQRLLPLHHSRRYALAQPRLEEGLLLYCPQGRYSHTAICARFRA